MAAERHSVPLMALGPSLVRSFVHFGLQEMAVAFGQNVPQKMATQSQVPWCLCP